MSSQRFASPQDPLFQRLNSSIAFDFLLLERPTIFLDVEAPFAKGLSLDASHRLSELAEDALTTLRAALDCFFQGDVARARQVIASDGKMDDAVARLVAELGAGIARDPALVPNGLAALMVAKHIERMAAHATNIAEMAIYITSAQDVRHVT